MLGRKRSTKKRAPVKTLGRKGARQLFKIAKEVMSTVPEPIAQAEAVRGNDPSIGQYADYISRADVEAAMPLLDDVREEMAHRLAQSIAVLAATSEDQDQQAANQAVTRTAAGTAFGGLLGDQGAVGTAPLDIYYNREFRDNLRAITPFLNWDHVRTGRMTAVDDWDTPESQAPPAASKPESIAVVEDSNKRKVRI